MQNSIQKDNDLQLEHLQMQAILKSANELVKKLDVSYCVRDVTQTDGNKLNAADIQDISDNQVHQKLQEKGSFDDVVSLHVQNWLNKAKPTNHEQQKTFFFSGDPASKRKIIETLMGNGDKKGLAKAQDWIEQAGASNITDIFHLDASEIRNRLLRDTQVLDCDSDLKNFSLPKIRAIGCAVHGAVWEAMEMLKNKGQYFNELNTDDNCPDWKTNPKQFLDFVKGNIERKGYSHLRFVSMLSSPAKAQKMAEEREVSPTLTPETIANKAKNFAYTLQRVIIPNQQIDALLVDEDLNVVFCRENGNLQEFDKEKYAAYLKSCDYPKCLDSYEFLSKTDKESYKNQINSVLKNTQISKSTSPQGIKLQLGSSALQKETKKLASDIGNLLFADEEDGHVKVITQSRVIKIELTNAQMEAFSTINSGT